MSTVVPNWWAVFCCAVHKSQGACSESMDWWSPCASC